MKSSPFLASRTRSVAVRCARRKFRAAPSSLRAPLASRHALLASLCALLAFFVFVSSAHAQNSQPAAPPAGESLPKGSITGRVVGEDGQPIANATVIAFSRGGSRANNSSGAASDATGKFTIPNLDPGAYNVNAFAPGYVLDADFTGDPTERNYYHVGDSVTLRLVKGGIITGTVTNANGDPVVGARVGVLRVREPDGRPVRESRLTGFSPQRQTDDRGVYRIYGLRPGAYLVMVGGKGAYSFGLPNAYDADAPTYYPSALRDTAVEVSVQSGQEMHGVDIRYRGEPGRAASGTVSAPPALGATASGTIIVSIKHAAASTPESFTFLQPGASERGFSFEGLADGDYDLAAQSVSSAEENAAAPARRIQIRGADVTGIQLTLAPLGSIAGRLAFEVAPTTPAAKNACTSTHATRPLETVIYARRDDPGGAVSQPFLFTGSPETTADGKGEFTLRSLEAGRYRPAVRLPGEDFYIRAMELPRLTAPPASKAAITTAATAATPTTAATAATAANDPARQGFALRAGERLSGLLIHVTSGAASLRGRVTATTEGASLPDNLLRVHLIPAERAEADNVLRYGEAAVLSGGAFSFANLAPGRYLLIARSADKEAAAIADNALPRPLAWDARTRATLRREAEAANVALDLAPCQRAADFVLRYQAK